jgi:hypothetical protein
MAALAALAAFVAGLALLFHLDANDLFAAVIAPAVAPVKELVEQIKSHFETARDKSDVDSRNSSAWAAGMAGDVPSEELLRRVQDRILAFRRRNHYVPDWLDNRLRDRNEAVMATTAADKAAEAARAGYG